jgi:hypothetical protein
MNHFKHSVQLLRERFPPLLPVRVYRRHFSDRFGDTGLVFGPDGRPHHFVIRIHSGLSAALADHFLVHEWGHAVAWREGHETVEDHDAEWGISHARIYDELFSD